MTTERVTVWPVNHNTKLVYVGDEPVYVISEGPDFRGSIKAAMTFHGSHLESGTWAPYQSYHSLMECLDALVVPVSESAMAISVFAEG